jgi:hypothetical protein
VTKRARPSKFWQELDRHLGLAGKNESWLARRLEVPVQTLSSWKQRNQFRRACLQHLGELLHWEGLDEMGAERLGVELIEGRVSAKVDAHPTEEVLRRIGREYRVAEKTFRRYSGHTGRIASMRLPPRPIRLTSSRTRKTAMPLRLPSPRPSATGRFVFTSAPTRKACRTIAIRGAMGSWCIKRTRSKRWRRFAR